MASDRGLHRLVQFGWNRSTVREQYETYRERGAHLLQAKCAVMCRPNACGCRITAIIPVFQTGDEGSIPSTRTTTMTTHSTSQPLLFAIPRLRKDLSEGARIVIEMSALASQLVAVTRTRTVHPDGRSENDAEHSLMLAKVAPELAYLLYPELDRNLIARFAVIHDDVEAYVGDTPTDMLAKLDQSQKDDLEQRGLESLLRDYGHVSEYASLIKQYETQSVAEARFVRAVDKLMVLAIHIPNSGEVLKANYTYDLFLQYEADLLKRDAYKYAEFDKVMDLRREIGKELADRYLLNDEHKR